MTRGGGGGLEGDIEGGGSTSAGGGTAALGGGDVGRAGGRGREGWVVKLLNAPLHGHMIPLLVAAWWKWDGFILENVEHLPQAFTLGSQLLDSLEGGAELSARVHM